MGDRQVNFDRDSFALELDKQFKCEAERKHLLIDSGTRLNRNFCN